MLKRQTSGSVVCPSCGRLVGVQENVCPHCGRTSPGLWGFSRVLQVLGQDVGFVKLIIGSCAVLYLLTLVTNPSGIGTGGPMSMLSPSSSSLFLFGASGAVPVYGYNRWWTILSATWLHGSLLHILFNMLWVRQLAPATARLYGPGRMMLIYLVAGAAGFLLSSTVGAFGGFLPSFLRGANLTIGASASIFGLLGALVYYGRRGGSTALGQQAWTWAMVLFVFGFIMPGIDNFAHLGGFLGGYGVSRVLNPFQPEKVDYLLAALIGLGLTLAAILASVVLGLPLVAR
ncbi:MAG: rhomboid family intramembrane serine protease [Thermoanaerobaculia bacterium]